MTVNETRRCASRGRTGRAAPAPTSRCSRGGLYRRVPNGQREGRVSTRIVTTAFSDLPPQPAGKPDGQLAGFGAGEPDRVQAAAPMPADPSGRPRQPVEKPDGQPAGSGSREPDRVQLPSARTMRDIRAAHPDPADKHALRERMDRLENRGARVSRRALIAEVRREQTEPADAPGGDGLPEPVADTRPLKVRTPQLRQFPAFGAAGRTAAATLDRRPGGHAIENASST